MSKTVNRRLMRPTSKDDILEQKESRDGLRTAIQYFNHAIEVDPTYAEAYSCLADSYALSGDWEYGVLSPQDVC